MKIIDCFTFFNELDLLEFRLKLLDPYVSQFVIAESDHTHSGGTKPYHFEENRKRFLPWLHKIVYIPVKQDTEGLVFEKDETKYNPKSSSWKLENEQRDALSAAKDGMADDDLVVIGDLDEIPDPRIFRKIDLGEEPRSFSMLFHYYFMNCQNIGTERWWNGTVICRGKQFRHSTPQLLRDKRNDWRPILKAGWHFSYLGGLEKIKYKIQSFAHTEFNKEEYTNDENILRSLEKGEDIFKRNGVKYKFVSLYYYPAFLRKVMLQYPAFINRNGFETGWQRAYYSFKNLFNN